jgi:sRNA-binding protein
MTNFTIGTSLLVDIHGTRMKMTIENVSNTSVRVKSEDGVSCWMSKEEFEKKYIIVEILPPTNTKIMLHG